MVKHYHGFGSDWVPITVAVVALLLAAAAVSAWVIFAFGGR